MNTKGFTLIEVIIGIIMIGIASSLMLSFFNTGLVRSGDPLIVLDDNYSTFKAIQIVNADYRAKLESDPSLDISIYKNTDLSKIISGLSGIDVKGEYIDFTDPVVTATTRKVTEIVPAGSSIYVKITATKNQSSLTTILGN